jgi:hypothetical protein
MTDFQFLYAIPWISVLACVGFILVLTDGRAALLTAAFCRANEAVRVLF